MRKILILFLIIFCAGEIISCQSKTGNPAADDQAILEGKLKPGYACDDGAGLLFIDGKMVKSVSLNPDHNSYYVSVKDGKIYEEKIPSEIIK